MVYITKVRMVGGGSAHEHISEVQWRNPADGNSGTSTRETMTDWIKNKGGDARVSDGRVEAVVGVVQAVPPYIRTHADGRWTDNLLALPRY